LGELRVQSALDLFALAETFFLFWTPCSSMYVLRRTTSFNSCAANADAT